MIKVENETNRWSKTVTDLLEKASQKQKEIFSEIKNDFQKTNQRPFFHFACPAGWCNDPNGFSFYKNQLHLFYQWHPYSTVWGPMHWGHCVSKDFINWEILNPALAPDSNADREGCFSGTALDFNGQHIICYTGVSKRDEKIIQNQCIAKGDGLDYKKIESNPVVTCENIPFEFQTQDFRDPKIFEKDGKIFMVCVLKKLDGCGAMVLLENESKDFIHWTFKKVLSESSDGKTKMWECPDFFEIDSKSILIFSPQEMTEDFKKGFHDGNNCVYMIGKMDFSTFEFKKEKFENQLPYTQIDYGIDFYAPQTTSYKDGRRIMIAWMQSWESPVTPKDFLWNGMMTFPRELSIKNNRLFQTPVKEILSYRKNHQNIKIDENSTCKIEVPDSRHCDLEIDLYSKKDFGKFIFHLGDEDFYVEIQYDFELQQINFDRSHTLDGGGLIKSRGAKILPMKNGCVHLRFLVDTNSIEVFANFGEVAFTNAFFIPTEIKSISVKSNCIKKTTLDYYQIY